EPLDGNRKLSANEDLQVQKGPLSLTEKLAYDPTRGTNLSVGAGYTRGAFTGGVQYDTNFQGNNAVKATITFRF
ncbi:MAG TPA: hypothetical protein VFF73_23915, partial [Planctomycetota bacterium]|nr:hypothetical protein [Planctomycetota bacterium]